MKILIFYIFPPFFDLDTFLAVIQSLKWSGNMIQANIRVIQANLTEHFLLEIFLVMFDVIIKKICLFNFLYRMDDTGTIAKECLVALKAPDCMETPFGRDNHLGIVLLFFIFYLFYFLCVQIFSRQNRASVLNQVQ